MIWSRDERNCALRLPYDRSAAVPCDPYTVYVWMDKHGAAFKESFELEQVADEETEKKEFLHLCRNYEKKN